MIGKFFMATKDSSADPSHTPRKLKACGGKIDHSTKQIGLADGLTMAFSAHGWATGFTAGIVTSRCQILLLHWRNKSVYEGRCTRYMRCQPLLLCPAVSEMFEAKQDTNRSNHRNVRQLKTIASMVVGGQKISRANMAVY